MTDWTEIDNSLLDPYWYAKNEYHGVFKLLRDEDPIHLAHDQAFGRDYWVITRYDDTKEYLLNDHDLSNRIHTHVPRTPKRMTPEERYAVGFDVAYMMNDNPLHDLYRRPFNKHFTPPAVARLQGHIDGAVDEILDEIGEKGEAEVVADIALGLPTKVVLRWLGVPEEDWPELLEAMWLFSTPADPRFMIAGDPIATAEEGHRRLWSYCEKLATDRLQHPRDDFSTEVVNMTIDGEPMSMHELVVNFFFLISGALENTRNALSTGIWLLGAHAEQRALVREDPSLMKGAVEEVIRWGSPSANRMRIANRDFEFRGHHIRSGDWVVAFVTSANRDERQFKDPDAFDVRRTPNKHLGFGDGVHLCLGRNLARLEMATMFQRLFDRFDLEFTEEPRWVADAFANGVAYMPVSLTPAVSRGMADVA